MRLSAVLAVPVQRSADGHPCSPRAAALQIQVKELKMQLKAAGGAPEATLLQMDGSDAPMSAREREELAVALTAGEGDRRTVDAQVGDHHRHLKDE
jgi:hypothetical protein